KDMLTGFIGKDYSLLEQMVLNDHRDMLISKGWLILANTSIINWNSRNQVLPLVRLISPRAKDLASDTLARISHPLIKDLEDFKDSLKLISSYGENFIEKYVEPDGKVRGNYNQIVSTGRVS